MAEDLFSNNGKESVLNRTESRVLIQSAARTLRQILWAVGDDAGLNHKARLMSVEMCNQLVNGVKEHGISAEDYDRQ